MNEVTYVSKAQRAFSLAVRGWLPFEFATAGFSNRATALTITALLGMENFLTGYGI